MDLLKCFYVVIIALLCVKQVCSQVPPGLVLKDSTAGCHGASGEDILKVNATCNTGHVLAINEITMGAKPTGTNCPLYWNSSFGADCCTNEANDCTFPFDINKQYHELCNGKSQCISDTQHQSIACDNFNGSYGYLNQFSNYMFIDFYCVPGDHTVDMCTSASTTAETDTVYVWNRAFTTTSIAAADTSCECSIEIDNCDSDIEIYKLYRQLAGNSSDTCEQNITVNDANSDTLLTWNCADNNLNFDMETVASTYITVSLNNQHTQSDGKFWFGFRGKMSSNITINCPAQPQENCVISTTTSTVPTTTTTETPTTTTTETPTTTTTETPTTTSTTDSPTTTTTDQPSTTTSDPTSSTAKQTSTTSSITTTDSLSTTTDVTSTSPDVTSGLGSNDQGDIYMIVAIVLGSICLVLIIVIVTMCICWRIKRNSTDSKDIENPQPEVARTDFKNSKLEFNPNLPPLAKTLLVSSSLQEKCVPNGVIKAKTVDSGCQTRTPLPKLTDVTCQTAPTPMTKMNSISCQTGPVNPTIIVMSKNATCQTELETSKSIMNETVTKMNSVDVAVQTDKKRKHKILGMANKVCPDNEVATTTEHPHQAATGNCTEGPIEHLQQAAKGNNTEDLTDDLVLPKTEDYNQTEHPKKRKKKKKKHDSYRHNDDGDMGHTLLEVAPKSERVNTYTELHEPNQGAPTDERVVVPGRNTQILREVSEHDGSDVESSKMVYTLNETERRFIKHRISMEQSFYSSEIAEEKLMKSLLKSEHKKQKKKRRNTKSDPQIE